MLIIVHKKHNLMNKLEIIEEIEQLKRKKKSIS